MPGLMAAEAYVAIRAEQQNLGRDLSGIRSMVLGAVSGIVGSVTEMGTSMGAGLFAGFVEKAISAEENLLRFDQAVRAAGANAGFSRGQFDEMNASIVATSTFSKGAVYQAEQMLLRFSQLRGDTFTNTLESAKDLAAFLGSDMPSAAMILGRALQNPGEGFRALEMHGISFTNQQKEQIRTMEKMGDTAGAQAFILNAVTQSVGGFAARYRETLGGQLELMQNKISAMQKGIGEAMLPAFKSLLPVTDELIAAITKNKDVFQDLGGAMAAVLGYVAHALVAIIHTWGEMDPKTKAVVKGLVMAAGAALVLGSVIGPVVSGVGAAGSFLAGLATPLGVVAALVTVVAAAFATAFKDPELGPRLTGALGKVAAVVREVAGTFTSLGGGLRESLGAAFHWVQERIVNVVTAIAGWVEANRATFVQWGQAIAATAAAVFSTIKAYLGIVMAFWGAAFSEAFRGLSVGGAGVMGTITGVLETVKALAVGIANFLDTNREAIHTIAGWFGTLWASGFRLLGQAISYTWDMVRAFWSWLGSSTGITWGGVIEGIKASFDYLQVTVENLPLVANWAWAHIKLGAAEMADALVNAFKTVRAAAEAAFTSMVSGFISAWTQMQSGHFSLAEVGKSMADSFTKTFAASLQDQGAGTASELTRQLRAQAEDLDRQLQEKRREIQGRHKAEEAATAAAVAAVGGPKGTPKGKGGEDEVRVKFDFTGFADLAKQIQTAMTGGSMEALQKRAAAAQEQTAGHTKRAADALEDLGRFVKSQPARPAVLG